MKTEIAPPNNLNILLAGWLIRIIFFISLTILILVPLTTLSTIIVLHFPNIPFIGGMLPVYFSVFVGFFISSSVIEKLRLGRHWHTYGVSINKFVPKDIWTGFSLAFGSMLFIMFLGILFGNLPILNQYNLTLESLFLTIFIILFAATVEEFIFRGIIFQAFSQRFGFAITALISSILFAAGHVFNPSFSLLAMFNTFLAGLVLASMYHQTKSLWMPISFHFFWNLLQLFVLGSNVSGLEDMGVPLFRMHLDTLPSWLFGGHYGIEGSIIATFTLIVLIFLTAKNAYTYPDLSAFIFKRQILENEILQARKLKKLQ